MTKPSNSMADQIAALGITPPKVKKPADKKPEAKQPVGQQPKRKREPDVSDMEAQMRKKLAASGEAAEVALPNSSARTARNGKTFGVEVRKNPPSRAVDPARRPQKETKSPGTPTSKLKPEAAARLHYEPTAKPIINRTPSPPEQPKQKKPEPVAPAEIPGVTRPFTAEEAFVHITSLVSASTPAIEDRPERIKAADKQQLDAWCEAGAIWLRDHQEPDHIDGYMIGFDFGTSALKVVVREPYKSGNDVAAMPAPEQLRSQGHPYLWQTVVWFDPADETFHLYPKSGAIALEGFKTGLIGGHGQEPIHAESGITRAQAASAFMALHLCHLLGWFNAERPLPRCDAANYLGVNIGVPVATQDDPKALQPFREVVVAAVELARSCEPITLTNVRGAIAMVKDESLPNGFELVPELSAALVGYAMDDTKPMGAHMLIDVGASTLDMVAFNLIENDGEPEIKAFSASVELLGAAALEIARDSRIADRDFSMACGFQFDSVYKKACQDDIAPREFSKSKNPLRKDVQLVVTGGGCATTVHAPLIDRLATEGHLGTTPHAKPEPPRKIAAVDCDRSRLLLAYGLAHDHPDIPHPTLPSGIPPNRTRPKDGPSMVGAEQT